MPKTQAKLVFLSAVQYLAVLFLIGISFMWTKQWRKNHLNLQLG